MQRQRAEKLANAVIVAQGDGTKLRDRCDVMRQGVILLPRIFRVRLVLRGNLKRGTEQNDDNREHADDGHGFLVHRSHDFSLDSSQEPRLVTGTLRRCNPIITTGFPLSDTDWRWDSTLMFIGIETMGPACPHGR